MTAFRPDRLTRVLLVKAFRKGEVLDLRGRSSTEPNGAVAATASDMRAPNDICVVKMVVGPGNPGPADAPSTSEGIHMEVWLPSPTSWNNRIRVNGSGGYSGLAAFRSTEALALGVFGLVGLDGWVVASSDDGHVGGRDSQDLAGAYTDGKFAMNPDGTPNNALWRDFSERGLHETALKTKALVELYYGRPAARSYFIGGSNGGRMALKSAQAHPEDFDGLLATNPGINWTHLLTYTLYPQIVFQRDLGGTPPTQAQLDLVSAAAVSACDTDLNGEHAGYISDPAACRYDPTKDKSVLCVADGGDNATNACVSRRIATAINKIWFGMTEDGSVPDPAVSNGFGTELDTRHKQLWFGISRGTRLFETDYGVALARSSPNGDPEPFPLATTQVALQLQNPRIAQAAFRNATSNGAEKWKTLSYADLARAYWQGIEMQPMFGEVDSNNPDLRRFRDQGGKLIVLAGMADELIPFAGLVNYYTRVSERTAPLPQLQEFFRLYAAPALGHTLTVGSVNGLEGVSPPVDPPRIETQSMFDKLVEWVEEGKASEDIVISNSTGAVSRPLCLYPRMLKYQGGDRSNAASYICE